MARASDNSIRKFARDAIKSQYTTSGKPIVNDVYPHDEVVSVTIQSWRKKQKI